MARPTDWWVLGLDRDPTPGDPDAVRRLARTFADFAYDVASAERTVSGLGGADVITQWVGSSGDAFRDEFRSLPPDLRKLHISYDMCALALETYAPRLESAQRQADRALADARAAREALSSANNRLASAGTWVTTAGQQAQRLQNQPPSTPKPDPAQVAAATRNAAAASAAHNAAQGAVNAAQSRLNAAQALASQAEQSRLSAARECASDIHKASDAGIHNLHWWQRAFNWVADHWGQIITTLKVVAFVLAIVVMIVGGPLAWVLVGISAVLTLNALVKAAEGKGSWWDVAFNALGCIPITEGLTSFTALRDAFAEGGLLGVGAHLLGAMRGTISKVLDAAKNSADLKDIFIGVGGGGGDWTIIDEAAGGAVRQITAHSCVSACGEMLTDGRLAQADIWRTLGDSSSAPELASVLGASGEAGWDAGYVAHALDPLLRGGRPWAAEMFPTLKTWGVEHHMIIVDGLDDAGRVSIRDPWEGSAYKMTVEEFESYWTGIGVFHP